MRLTPAQIDTIQSTVHAVLGEGVQVTLFGSRVHHQPTTAAFHSSSLITMQSLISLGG
jgi:hypothetical protein